jgi:hypothetical protein
MFPSGACTPSATATRSRIITTVAIIAGVLAAFVGGGRRGIHAASPADVGSAEPTVPERILANDNRVAAGVLHDGVLTLHLVAREGRWYPESDSGKSIVVQAFAEEGRPPRIPGPLVRVPSGTLMRVSVRNTLDRTLVVFGMHERPSAAADTLVVLPGATRETAFRAGAPASYVCAGRHPHSPTPLLRLTRKLAILPSGYPDDCFPPHLRPPCGTRRPHPGTAAAARPS